MKTVPCEPLRPPHRPAACCWSSIPAPDRRRMSPDRKHRRSHRRRPCRTHCPDRKVWATFLPPIAPKGRRQYPNRSGPCRRDCFRRPRKVSGVTFARSGPSDVEVLPAVRPGKSARRFTVRGLFGRLLRVAALRSLSRSLPSRGSSPRAVSARRSPPAR